MSKLSWKIMLKQAKRNRANGEITWDLAKTIVKLRDGYFCRYCGTPVHERTSPQVRSPSDVHIDHVHTYCWKTHEPKYLVVSCLKCNMAKFDRSVEEWAELHFEELRRLGRILRFNFNPTQEDEKRYSMIAQKCVLLRNVLKQVK